jgi:hypothetical protein
MALVVTAEGAGERRSIPRQGRTHVPAFKVMVEGDQPPLATECTTCWYSK